MDFEQFQEIIREQVIPIYKKRESSIGKTRKKEITKLGSLTPYFAGWNSNVREYHENAVHSEEVFPEILFKDIAPNQTEEDLRYIRDTYQAITSEVFLAFSNTVKRGLTNGAIEYYDNKDEAKVAQEYKEYIDKNIPQFGSLYEYMKALVDQKLTDANAVVGVHFHAKTDEEGKVMGKVLPYPEIYHSNRVVYVDPDDSIIVMRHEKSDVLYGGKKESSGLKFICFTKDYYYYADQVGKKSDYDFEFSEFEHELYYVPAMRLMGMPRVIEGKLNFTSPFHRAVYNLNLAVLDNTNLLLIKRKVGYPTRAFVAEPCRNQSHGSTCDNGIIRWSDGDQVKTETCGACRGSGMVGVFGPNSELMIKNDVTPDGKTMKPSESMAYISPPIDTPKFLREEIDQYLEKSKENLHLKAEPRTAGNITATEKNNDLKNTEAFIRPISDQIWHLYGFLLRCIGELYLGEETFDKIKPNVIPAKELDIITTEDYINQLAEAKKNGLPTIVIQSLIYNLMRSSNYTDSQTEKVFELIQNADRLWTSSTEQVALALSRGTAQKWESVLHESAIPFIMNLIREYQGTEEKPTFFHQDMSVQVELLQAMAKAKSAEMEGSDDLGLPPAEEI